MKWIGDKSPQKFCNEWMAGDIIGLAVCVPKEGVDAVEGSISVSCNRGCQFVEPQRIMVTSDDLIVASEKGVFAALTASFGISIEDITLSIVPLDLCKSKNCVFVAHQGFSFKYNFGEEPFKCCLPDYEPLTAFYRDDVAPVTSPVCVLKHLTLPKTSS